MKRDFDILFVDQTGELGGAELCLAEVAFRLRHRSSVLLFEAGPFQRLLEERGIKTILLQDQPRSQSRRVFRGTKEIGKKSKLGAYFFFLPAFVRLLFGTLRAARAFDLLYANTAKALIVTALVSRVLRKPFLFHLHDIIDADHFAPLNRWLLVNAANHATGIIANSEATARAYQKAGGHNRNLKVLPNGFDIERFGARTEEEIWATRSAICSEDQFLVGLFGRITKWKGQKVLIRALSRLQAVSVVIVGDALFTDEDRQYKQELVDLVRQLGLEDRVHFAGFQQDVLPFLEAVDIVVHCSIFPEPFGRVIVEAQLAGKPVIAARGGAAPEIVEDGVSGILVAPGDSVGLASAIESLLRDPARAGQMAAKGRELAEQHYALDGVLRNWVDFIDQSIRGVSTNTRATTLPYSVHGRSGAAVGLASEAAPRGGAGANKC